MSLKSLLNNELYGRNSRNGLNIDNTFKDNDYLLKKLKIEKNLNVHSGCVNSISWSEDGELILSASDDRHLSISNPFNAKCLHSIKTLHRGNIFSAKFLPKSNDETLISCAASGEIFMHNIYEPMNHTHKFSCHGERTCFELKTVPYESTQFVSCGQDGTIKWFDLRIKSKCDKQMCDVDTLIHLTSGISAIALNPSIPYHLVCGSQDGFVRFYDRRMLSVGNVSSNSSHSDQGLFGIFGLSKRNFNINDRKRITSLQYDSTGNEILVSYQPDKLFLLDWRQISPYNNEFNNEFLKNGFDKLPNNNFINKKFRIQTDWSDTGPESLRLNDTPDEIRNPIIRRLNDWFQEIYRQRRSSTNDENDEDDVIDNEESTNENDGLSTDDIKNSISESSSHEFDINEDERKKTHMLNSFIKFREKARELSKRSLIEQPTPKILQTYSGHRNSRTFIKECNFWGSKYVISGSDCGHVYFWNKENGRLVHILEADKHVVNCVQENPLYPILATSGIDYDVKIWQPTLENSLNLGDKLELISKRNKELIHEAKDTIVVPVQFMLPALRLFTGNRGSR